MDLSKFSHIYPLSSRIAYYYNETFSTKEIATWGQSNIRAYCNGLKFAIDSSDPLFPDLSIQDKINKAIVYQNFWRLITTSKKFCTRASSWSIPQAICKQCPLHVRGDLFGQTNLSIANIKCPNGGVIAVKGKCYLADAPDNVFPEIMEYFRNVVVKYKKDKDLLNEKLKPIKLLPIGRYFDRPLYPCFRSHSYPVNNDGYILKLHEGKIIKGRPGIVTGDLNNEEDWSFNITLMGGEVMNVRVSDPTVFHELEFHGLLEDWNSAYNYAYSSDYPDFSPIEFIDVIATHTINLQVYKERRFQYRVERTAKLKKAASNST